jgi:hypothetical protein
MLEKKLVQGRQSNRALIVIIASKGSLDRPGAVRSETAAETDPHISGETLRRCYVGMFTGEVRLR